MNGEYSFFINENGDKGVKHCLTNQEINIIFDSQSETNIIEQILNQLSKYYIEDILNLNI